MSGATHQTQPVAAYDGLSHTVTLADGRVVELTAKQSDVMATFWAVYPQPWSPVELTTRPTQLIDDLRRLGIAIRNRRSLGWVLVTTKDTP